VGRVNGVMGRTGWIRLGVRMGIEMGEQGTSVGLRGRRWTLGDVAGYEVD
jgi:hypothetical protein